MDLMRLRMEVKMNRNKLVIKKTEFTVHRNELRYFKSVRIFRNYLLSFYRICTQ